MTVIVATDWPSAGIAAQFASGVVRRRSWVDIYAADNSTLLWGSVPITDGTVTVDGSRVERRSLELTISDSKSSLNHIGYGPGKIWYDKVFKPYTGIVLANGDTWVMKLGEFLPDRVSRPHFPEVISVSCRDFSKKLINAKFEQTTTFTAGAPNSVGAIIKAIAVAGGLDPAVGNYSFTDDFGIYLPLDATFERGSERMASMTTLAASKGWEVYFDGQGRLNYHPIFRPQAGVSVAWTFSAAQADSNLVDFSLSTNDSFLKNKIVVYGAGTENSLVFAVASNTTASSPTRIAAIGERNDFLANQFIVDNTAAQNLADAILSVSALEQYEMSLNGVVLPWLESGQNVMFNNPDAESGDPINYYISSVSIPLGLGAMSGNVKRVTTVG